VRFLLAACLLLLLPFQTFADERILDYQSAITVLPDAGMLVSETIRVRAEGRAIRHGIYRDFPTDYRDRFGNRFRVAFQVVGAERDGHAEPYHSKRIGNGVRVYLGASNRLLPRGEHTYVIRYRTDRQLGYFADHDELYWNVTGNGWAFPIDHVEASVHLPAAVPAAAIHGEAYTGRQGARGHAWRSWQEGAVLHFETTAPLAGHEGLTIVASWPKGYVHQPDTRERLGRLLADNRHLFAGGAGLLLLYAFYLLVWWRLGRDPAPGNIIPLYTPPEEHSPASLRYLRRMGYDNKTFATALVGLAVKGALLLEQRGDKYVATRRNKRVQMGPGEQALMGRLFAHRDEIVFEQANHTTIGAARSAHRRALARHYEKRYFVGNGLWLLPGILITLAVLAVTVALIPDAARRATAAFMAFWLSGWSVGVSFLGIMVFKAWKAARSGGGYGGAVFISLFALPFLFGEFAGIGVLGSQGGVALVPILLLAVAANVLFYQLLKAPTLAGRRLLDRVDGFRLYLEVAEGDELKLAGGPRKTPALFEQYLPYAMALDLEQHWAERFTEVFAAAQRSGQPYTPAWYHGGNWNPAQLGAFGASLGGALTSAISSSATPPGSSSGGGGGGSSGGGGGGGGGGGW